MTDAMMRNLLQVPLSAAAVTMPRLIIDAAHFTNDSSQRIDRNLIADRLRVSLARAAKCRLAFVGREHRQVVAGERYLKRSSQVDCATRAAMTRQAGADYRLVGRISTLDSGDNTTGVTQRFTQIAFDMIDLETSLSVWTNLYSFIKRRRQQRGLSLGRWRRGPGDENAEQGIGVGGGDPGRLGGRLRRPSAGLGAAGPRRQTGRRDGR